MALHGTDQDVHPEISKAGKNIMKQNILKARLVMTLKIIANKNLSGMKHSSFG